jgi:hypothetical protein
MLTHLNKPKATLVHLGTTSSLSVVLLLFWRSYELEPCELEPCELD